MEEVGGQVVGEEVLVGREIVDQIREGKGQSGWWSGQARVGQQRFGEAGRGRQGERTRGRRGLSGQERGRAGGGVRVTGRVRQQPGSRPGEAGRGRVLR